MRAGLLDEHGGVPRVVDDHPDPARGAAPEGLALVRVRAVPLTPLDVLCASGTSYFGAPALPYVPGVQGVGEVVEAAGLPAGTRVWFPTSAGMTPGDGALAELAVVPEADLVRLDAEAPDDTVVASLGLSAMAAWTALRDRGGLRPGERVLVLGSSGVVGSVAVRSAVLRGASAVFAAAVEPGAADAATALGAHGFVPLGGLDGSDREADVAALAERMRTVVGEVDVVLDPLCGVPASAAALCLAPHGRLVNLGSSAGADATFSSAHLRSGSRSILGFTNNDLTAERRAVAMAEILCHAAAGQLAVDHEVFGLDDLPAAWEAHRAGRVRGRAVVRIG
ncbi:hypothetical protein BJF80_13760 [Serinicoccus sp. CUA-874]|uniref:quinone oxidoreductase family protein n=1 Tax=Serinicoccus sp. CUA-874 TaxID=1517939 RepID=UPI0009677B0C|nr:zinc-binding dehydrogenase [Serinicoccus sp. CUA-874]OLT18913.1 hypothetical protein BJF80_13760 [Serinicoccus sp. CUA-874]